MQIAHPRLDRRGLLRVLVVGSAALVLPRRRPSTAALPAPGLSHDAGDRPAGATYGGAERLAAHFDDDGAIPLLIPDDVREDEAWVDVNLTELAAVAMIGREWVHVALVTTGRPGWDTPEGEFRVVRRVANETMTSAALNITDPRDQYVLTNVLYTQYFTWYGHALHLNYWQPDSVFGETRTSHGCVGMRLADARFFWEHLRISSRVVVHS